ncbi:MAG: hypothetical protein ACNA76_03945 [Anaerosomatales bacterium]
MTPLHGCARMRAQHLLSYAALILGLALLAASTACSPIPPDIEPTIRGVITQITPGPEGTGIVLIVWHESLGEVYELDSIAATIAESYPPQGTADAVRVIGEFDEIRPLPIPRGLIEP